MLQLIEFAYMLVIDLIFLVALVLLMLPLGIWRQAAFAVMKRNFIGYFSNPTGYVFLCLFVLLTSFAAFWPHEFFTTNLANFDQLNKFLPYIMLIFIPAITMSIWAEERRQGTDELLLTLPAHDFDIVIGKYFAAVLVFTVSLLFSQLSNYAVLLAMTGGSLDNLLLFSTYLGYWFMGIAMIALGMVASFLTSNLTVGFIFGAALNAPLAFFSNADVIFSNSKRIQQLFEWSLLQRFEPFGRGLISASSIFYFLAIVVIGIYLSLILIGRRHWLGGRDGTSMLWHYVIRAACLIVLMVGAVLIVQHSPLNRARVDISDSKVSTLSESTIKVLDDLANDPDGSKPPIEIEAYVSNNVPSEFVKTKYDLVNLLREFDVLGGKRVQVNLHQGIEPFSEEAILAEKKYGIRPTAVTSQSRGALREEEIVLGVAFSCGRERIVIPFLPYGMSVEYELMRSINTVSQSERKTVGIVRTDALVMGAAVTTRDAQGQLQTVRIPRMRIISELQKQYNVELVDASSPISLWLENDDDQELKRRFDVLLVVQPSKMIPIEMQHLIEAIQSGQPTAVFEDPLPNREIYKHVPGTFFPRAFSRVSAESADVQRLWDALELDVDHSLRRLEDGSSVKIPWIVWQLASENPYPRDSLLNQQEQIIVHDREQILDPRFSSTHPATMEGRIDELYFQFAGNIQSKPKSKLNFEPLVTTSRAGRVKVSDMLTMRREQLESVRGSANQNYVIAAQITGNDAGAKPKTPEQVQPNQAKTDVIYVADIDILSDFFVQMRNFPIRQGIEYRYQDMSFVLNVIDTLAGEETYLSLRNRKVKHVTLEVVERTYEKSMQEVYDQSQQFQIDFEVKRNQIINDISEKTRPLETAIKKELAKKDSGKSYDAVRLAAMQGLLNTERREQAEKFQTQVQELENERRDKKRRTDLDAELEIQEIQRKFKLAAVIIPPIPPLLVGLVVLTRRRLREREGISKARRLK
jgi:ABC-2 type transport system permease protein